MAAILIFRRLRSPLITLHDILERARAAGQKLAAGEALWLFAAVTRLAAAQKSTVRSRLVHLDPSGSIQLARFDEKRADDEPGYLAPELLERGAPAKTEPRVQVYAAGALGYELLTGQPAPDPRKGPGPELTGPVADLVRFARPWTGCSGPPGRTASARPSQPWWRGARSGPACPRWIAPPWPS